MQLGVREAARLLGVSEKTIYRWIKEGRLPAYRINEQHRFNRAELLECLRAHIADRALALKMGEQARKTAVEKYSMARVADELLEIYGERKA